MDYAALQNKQIIELLIGNQPVYENEYMPYYTGDGICSLGLMFGRKIDSTKNGIGKSRWDMFRDILIYMEHENRTSEFLAYLFEFARFTALKDRGSIEEVRELYNQIVQGALQKINEILVFSGTEMRIVNKQFVLCKADEEVVYSAPKVHIVTNQYIRELPERIKGDIENQDYDSVITKSRTLLEEVLIYIIEKTTKERYKSKGDLVRIYNEMRELMHMKQQSDWDKRVNELLNGINQIVNAVASMRNMNSDAHGVGTSRITINKREALLVANSSMMVAEYWLSVFNNEKG